MEILLVLFLIFVVAPIATLFIGVFALLFLCLVVAYRVYIIIAATRVKRLGKIEAEKHKKEMKESKKVCENQTKEESSAILEIKKYKEMLDNEIITKEEFEAKKKHLLGL